MAPRGTESTPRTALGHIPCPPVWPFTKGQGLESSPSSRRPSRPNIVPRGLCLRLGHSEGLGDASQRRLARERSVLVCARRGLGPGGCPRGGGEREGGRARAESGFCSSGGIAGRDGEQDRTGVWKTPPAPACHRHPWGDMLALTRACQAAQESGRGGVLAPCASRLAHRFLVSCC